MRAGQLLQPSIPIIGDGSHPDDAARRFPSSSAGVGWVWLARCPRDDCSPPQLRRRGAFGFAPRTAPPVAPSDALLRRAR